MGFNKIIKNAVFSLIVMIIILAACSPRSNYNIRSFLFDGVPNPFEEVEVTIIDTVNLKDQDSIVVSPGETENPMIIHPPFQEKRCGDCHDANRQGQYVSPKNTLCFNCHDNYNDFNSNVHGPVSSGYCTECHNPHRTRITSLLLEEKNTLCFKCHNEEHILKSSIHISIGDESCIQCHNPHAGENRSFLRPNACYNCHTNFEKENKFIHGPVDAGLCNACHKDHQSKETHLLVTKGSDLCLTCHSRDDLNISVVHKNNNDRDCIECHDPHGANREYLLTSIIEKNE